jgi:hypothetical protein
MIREIGSSPRIPCMLVDEPSRAWEAAAHVDGFPRSQDE